MPKIDLTFFSGYLGYTLLGYVMAKREWKVSIPVLAISILLLILFNAAGTWKYSLLINKFSPAFYGYLGLNNAVLASLVFLLCKRLIVTAAPTWLQTLDNHSFGIYLAHIIVLNYVHPLVNLPILYKIPIATLITFIGSFMVTYLIRKIPYGSVISG